MPTAQWLELNRLPPWAATEIDCSTAAMSPATWVCSVVIWLASAPSASALACCSVWIAAALSAAEADKAVIWEVRADTASARACCSATRSARTAETICAGRQSSWVTNQT
ncbi:hypothetical protein D9M70_463800 [compost metagenome]